MKEKKDIRKHLKTGRTNKKILVISTLFVFILITISFASTATLVSESAMNHLSLYRQSNFEKDSTCLWDVYCHVHVYVEELYYGSSEWDPRYRPLSDVTVTAWGILIYHPSYPKFKATTDESGKCVLHTLPGLYRLTAYREGYHVTSPRLFKQYLFWAGITEHRYYTFILTEEGSLWDQQNNCNTIRAILKVSC